MHIYETKENKLVPSVTTVLSVIAKPDLIDFANFQGLRGINHKEFLEDVAMVGTITHQYIEQKLTNQQIDFSNLECSEDQIQRANVCMSKFDEWFSYQELELIDNEKSLISEKYGYGGTIDCICKLNGVNTLIDWKTSSSIGDDYKVQVSAYKQMAEENGYNIEKCVILRIGRKENEPFQYYEVTKNDLKLGFNVFKSALNLYNVLEDFKANKSKGRKKKGN